MDYRQMSAGAAESKGLIVGGHIFKVDYPMPGKSVPASLPILVGFSTGLL